MSAEQPNVLLIMSDEHNFRCLGGREVTQRGEPVHTPTLDDLAGNGTNFEQTYCPVPLCTPSRISLLTGREAHNCGAWSNGSLLQDDLPTLPETLGNAGYETCLVGKMHLGGNRQFVGFNHRPYGDVLGRLSHQPDPVSEDRRSHELSWSGMEINSRLKDAGVSDIPESLHQDRVVATEATAFLRNHAAEHPDQPWFMCASFNRPHFPLTTPARHFDRYWEDGVTEPTTGPEDSDASSHPLSVAKREGQGPDDYTEEELLRGRAAYFGSVDYLDEILGDFLDDLGEDGLLEDTIIVYLSDHGEMAGEHGMWWKRTYHEDSTRVPFFVQLPEHRDGSLEGTTITEPVSLVDVFPTICGLLDVDPPVELDGADLSASIATGTSPDRGPVFCDLLTPMFKHNWNASNHEKWPDGLQYRMVRDGSYKYIGFRDATELLFDVSNDPRELTNLATSSDSEHRAVLERLRGLVAETMDFEEAERSRAKDAELQSNEFALLAPRGTSVYGNTYQLPDGRIVDAGTPLYSPDVLVERPERTFDDWPR